MTDPLLMWALGILGSLVAAMLGTYFIWLGTAVNEIGKKVERMDVNVNSLLSARDREQDQRSGRNSDRLDVLERGQGRPTE